MSLASILKACAIVGLSAVTMISTMLKVKEEQNGLINQPAPTFNNGNPYNGNTGEMNMYNNNAYGSQSRRFYGCAQPSYPMANGPMMMGPYQQPMRPITFGSPIPQPSAQLQMALAQNGYSVPCYNGAVAYQGGFNAQQQYGYTPSGYSRRNMMPNGMYQQQPQQNPYSNPFIAQNMMNMSGVYREPTYSQYGYGYDSGVSALYSGSSYGYGYSDDYGYGNYQQQQPMNNYGYTQPQQSQVQTLGSYNRNLIGSAARYRCWSPETSGCSCTYYGYDDNTPSYPTSAPTRQPMMQQPMMNNYGYQQPMMQPQTAPQQPQYTDEQMRLFEEIERYKQSEAARMNAMRQQQRVMNDPMDGRLHNTIRPINTENAWYSRTETTPQVPQQPMAQPRPSNVINAPIPPFMQNGPAEMQQPNPPKSVGNSVTLDAMLSNMCQPEPEGPKSPDDIPAPNIVMQFGDNWVPVEQQAEAYGQPQQQQPQQPQSTGVQPLYTIPEEPQPQQPTAPPPQFNPGISMV